MSSQRLSIRNTFLFRTDDDTIDDMGHRNVQGVRPAKNTTR